MAILGPVVHLGLCPVSDSGNSGCSTGRPYEYSIPIFCYSIPCHTLPEYRIIILDL